MGNNFTKDETNFLEELDGSLNINSEIEANISNLPENSSFRSCTSSLSEFSLPLEDAVSITTDSPTTTEYESANENDTSSNRLSSCTEIFIDIPVDVNSIANITVRNLLPNGNICCPDFKYDQICDEINPGERLYAGNTTADQNEILSKTGSNDTKKYADTYSELNNGANGKLNSRNNLISRLQSDEGSSCNTYDIIYDTRLYSELECASKQTVNDIIDRSMVECSSSITNDDTVIANKSATSKNGAKFATGHVNFNNGVIINESILDMDRNSNLTIRKKSQNDECLAYENKLLEMHTSANIAEKSCVTTSKSRKRNGNGVAKHDKSDRTRSMARKSKKQFTGNKIREKSPIVYKDFLILNYEHVFEEKTENARARSLDFDHIGNVFSKALNGATEMLSSKMVDASPSCENYDEDEFDREKIFPLCDATRYLNVRCCYSTFFQFNIGNVFVYYEDCLHQIEESLVKQFLSNRWLYSSQLDYVTFCMLCNAYNMCYAITVSDELLCSNLKDAMYYDARIERTERNTRCSKASFRRIDETKNDENWSDLDSEFGRLSSLHSEITECVIQLDGIDSEIMNCNEHVSEAGPVTAADIDNINNMQFLNNSTELDYISKAGGTGLVAENLRKQSLYVKFDPLVSEDANSTFNGDETLTLNDTIINNVENPKNISKSSNHEDKNSSLEVTDSKNHDTGNVGKLISITPNKSPRKITPRSSPRFSEIDPDDVSKLQSLLLKQMKKEEIFKEEIESLKHDYEQALQKLHNTEKEVIQVKLQVENVQENEKKLRNELKERIKNKQQLSIVMEEYEKTISQMVSRREEEKKEFEATVKKVEAERDSTVLHLNNLENAFNDIHQKYERGKVVNEALKKNEDALKKSIGEYEVTVKSVENKYELLKSHATSQLEKANQELELITQSYEKEQAKLKALLKKSEIQINSLQNALDRKSKENQELAAICDELIVKLSTHSNA